MFKNLFLLQNKIKIIFRKPKGTKYFGDISNLNVGKNVAFGGNVVIFGNEKVDIGDYTIIAYGVTLHTSTHIPTNVPKSIERIDRPIKIGKHVWIGTGAIILPGVVVGDYSVIGAGSLVESNVPPKTVVAGTPARRIKSLDLLNEEYENFYSKKFRITKKGYIEKEVKNFR